MNNTLETFEFKIIGEAKSLTEKERLVLGYRLLNQSLREIGEKFGVSRERIREVEAKALRKIKWLFIWGNKNYELKTS